MKKNKKIRLVLAGVCAMALLAGCGKQTETPEKPSETAEKPEAGQEQNTQIGNPWIDTDREGLLEATGFEMDAPKGASDLHYSYMENMGQLKFTLDGNKWCYRIQPAEKLEDISGAYYEWDVEDPGTVAGKEAVFLAWSDADENTEYIDDVAGAQVVNWFDPEAGLTYSLYVAGDELNGMDLQVYAEQLYKPAKGKD